MTRVLLAVLLAASSSALAAGGPDPLQAQIERATRDSPRAFDFVQELKQDLPRLDREKQGPLAVVGPVLKSLGGEGLLPVLDELRRGARPPEVSSTARTAWVVGLLEAAGALGDPRAAPVLRQVFQSESDPEVLRAAAVALAKTDDGAIDLLLSLARARGPRQSAAIEGLAECREPRAAQALADLLASRDDPDRARLAARSLGQLGSYWVWQTPRYRDRPQRDEVRGLAARALIAGFASSAGELHAEAEKALLIVAYGAVQSLIDRAKAGAPAQRAELDRLVAHLAHNPIRPSGEAAGSP